MTELDTLRLKLDEIDRRMVALFEERMAVSCDIGRVKIKNGMPVRDEKREAAVLLSRANLCEDESLKAKVQTLYECILAMSRERQTALFFKEG